MSFIPSSILRRLYQRGSLRNVHHGVCFTIKNRLSEAALIGLGSVTINGDSVPIGKIKFTPLSDGGGEAWPGVDITETNPLIFKLHDMFDVFLEVDSLDIGEHHIELVFQSRPFGTLRLNIDEAVQEKTPDADHIPRISQDDYCEKAVNDRRVFLRGKGNRGRR